MDNREAERIRIKSEMMELFQRFAVRNTINYSGGNVDYVPHWTNATAEKRFNELKERLDKLGVAESLP